MKTKSKSIRSPGSLVVRGKNFYAYWRVKDSTGKLKAICKALRDERGAPITTRPEAEKAKAALMEIVAKEKQVDTLRSIAHSIDDTQTDLQRLKDEVNPPMPVSQVWTAFLRSTQRHDCGKSTLAQYEIKFSMFQRWLEREHPEVKSLRQITRPTAEAYLDTLNHGRTAPATFNGHLRILKYIFKILHDDARLTENVWDKAQPRTLIQHGRREFTVDELRKICASATGELRLLFAIGLYTGLRMGDACTLRWNEVDLRRNQIRRIPNKIRRQGGKAVVIPLHPVLAEMFTAIPADERGAFVLPATAAKYNSKSRTGIVEAIQAHLRACGIETTEAREIGSRRIVRAGFHSLRHSFISLCRESGAPMAVVQSIVGHSSPAMTAVYQHTSELAAKNAVAMLPAITGEAVEPRPTLRQLIESLTANNWRAVKAEALAMLPA
ncbi:MAG: tyrosine-type recombinase/integrase [Verrucomicrobiota bacterium]|jgi:integrase